MKSLRKYAMLAALLLGTGVLEAQTAPPPKPASATEMREQTAQIKTQLDAALRHVLHLQALARKEKDVIKLTCINDKLIQIKAQMDIYDTASLQLDGAISASDDQASQTVFVDVEKVGVAVKKLRAEADGCAGELELYKQESKSDVDRPELDDPTDGEPFTTPEQSGDTDIEPPAYATPFR